jgi:hypothetical protein
VESWERYASFGLRGLTVNIYIVSIVEHIEV